MRVTTCLVIVLIALITVVIGVQLVSCVRNAQENNTKLLQEAIDRNMNQ